MIDKHITMISAWSGRPNSMTLRMTQAQWDEWRSEGRKRFVQEIFPHLSAEEREFLLTGITPDEWNEAFASGME